jgi:hypothetical protein
MHDISKKLYNPYLKYFFIIIIITNKIKQISSYNFAGKQNPEIDTIFKQIPGFQSYTYLDNNQTLLIFDIYPESKLIFNLKIYSNNTNIKYYFEDKYKGLKIGLDFLLNAETESESDSDQDLNTNTNPYSEKEKEKENININSNRSINDIDNENKTQIQIHDLHINNNNTVNSNVISNVNSNSNNNKKFRSDSFICNFNINLTTCSDYYFSIINKNFYKNEINDTNNYLILSKNFFKKC